jgi:fructose-bisphosphate aldolase, class I
MPADAQKLKAAIQTILSPGHGILAADESTGTIRKRLSSINVENSEKNRRDYRDMLFTSRGFGDHISGVILYDETVDQKADSGETFSELIAKSGAVPGVKSDQGKDPHPKYSGQTLTKGLDGHAERLDEWMKRSNGTLGFTKWRQIIVVDPEPTDEFLEEAMNVLAEQGKVAIDHGYVPINEPEVLMDGSHTIEQCAEVTERTLKALYRKCEEKGIDVSLTLLKPNMVLSGKDMKTDSPEEVAKATIDVFEEVVPKEMPGIVFLSGGQTPVQATENLNAIARLAKERKCPWTFSFSYGRALQEDALKAWEGNNTNNAKAQAALLHRAKMNGLAQKGEWSPEMEKEAVGMA